MKKESSDTTITSIIDTLEILLRHHLPPEQTNETIEKLKLELVLKYLHCDSLHKKVKGINDLTEILKKSIKNKIKTYTFYSMPTDPNAGYLDRGKMSEWLLQNKIIEYLFGPNTHQELLQRSNQIFVFIVQEQKFEMAHLDLLWECCMVIKNFFFFLKYYFL